MEKEGERFLKELAEDKVDTKNLIIFLERKEHNFRVYYKNLDKINVILTKVSDNWIILDFLTP